MRSCVYVYAFVLQVCLHRIQPCAFKLVGLDDHHGAGGGPGDGRLHPGGVLQVCGVSNAAAGRLRRRRHARRKSRHHLSVHSVVIQLVQS